MGSPKLKTRKTTIVLTVIFVLTILLFIAYLFYPEYEQYRILKRTYKIYNGMTDELKDSELFEDLQSGKSFCFMGDSITYGSVTNGISWYQPLIPYIKGTITNVSFGGWTVLDLLEVRDNIPVSDVYVIAIGINDILYPNDPYSASTPDDFTNSCAQLANIITGISPNAKIYFIAPWTFLGFGDALDERGAQFRTALSEWCDNAGYIYINPDPIIVSVFNKEDINKYMYNDFHPNAPEGVGLFSYAVLLDAHNKKAALQ